MVGTCCFVQQIENQLWFVMKNHLSVCNNKYGHFCAQSDIIDLVLLWFVYLKNTDTNYIKY